MKLARPTAEQAQWQDYEIGMFFHYDLNVWMKPGWSHRSYEEWPSVFDPTQLDTDQWMEASQAVGAKYGVLTATHGTGFMLWQSDAYPFGVKQSPWRGGNGDVVRDFVASYRKCDIQPGLYSHMCVNGHWRVDHPGRVNAGKGGDSGREITGVDVVGLLKELQPSAVLFQGPTGMPNPIRWVGNERGAASYPCWSTAHQGSDEDGLTEMDLSGDPDAALWAPAECDVAVRENTWMWEPDTEDRLFSLEHLMDLYYRSVGRNCNLHLNANPNRDGLIPDVDMRRYNEFGAEVRRRFGKSLAETSGEGNAVELTLTKPTVIDHAIVMEQITEGERIREYTIEGWANGRWQPLGKGSCIGHKRIETFEPVTVSEVRLIVTKATAEPVIRRLAVYRTM